jgi:4-carboxymuconolactone decarboxylase
MARLPPITEADLDDAQRAVLEAIQKGPRGGKLGLQGPFGVYVRAPGVGDAAQNLGAAVRYNTGIAENVKEVAICTVGAFYKARFEFAAHAALAAKAGVDAQIVEALRVGEAPSFSDDRERIAHAIASALLREHRIDDDTYAQGKALLGETGMVELVTTVGYYCLVSMILNAFEIPLGESMSDPFPELG